MNSRSDVTWLRLDALLASHEMQLTAHGGSSGLRDAGLLESALARPQQFLTYGDPSPDVPALATLYAITIVRNHPFIDGNKRVGLIALELFLNLNGYEFIAGDSECVTEMLRLAARDTTDEQFAHWVRRFAKTELPESRF